MRFLPLPTRLIPVTALATALVALAALPSVATADPVALTGGHLDWGVKQSFREYVEASPTDGEISLSGGAFRNASGGIRFPVDPAGTGTYDPIADVGAIELVGAVRFTRHQTAPGSGVYALDLTFADLRLNFTADGAGTLFADVTSKDDETGQMEQFPDLAVADVDLSGSGPTVGTERYTWSTTPATILADAAHTAGIFGAFYGANTPLDPLSLTATTGVPSVRPATPVLSTVPGSPANDNRPTIKAVAPAGTTVRVYWGAGCTEAPIATASAEAMASGITAPFALKDNSTSYFSAIAHDEDSASECSATLTYREVTPSGPGGPNPPGGGSGDWIAWKPAKGKVTVSRKRTARIARIVCRQGPCRLAGPKTVKVKIAGKRFKVKVVAPRRVADGKTASVSLKLPRKAFARLAGRKAKVKLKVTVRSNGRKATRVLRATIRRKAS